MKEYLVPFTMYILLAPIIYFFTKNEFLAYSLKIVIVAACLYIYRVKYSAKIKFSSISVLFGCIIFLVWVVSDRIIPIKATFIPQDVLIIAIKLIGSILIAPIIEELFTRDFLARFIINPDWKKVKTGTYTLASFLITVAFFGFSHQQWLGGIITGILLNVLLYIKKDIGDCIFAHAVANLFVAVFVILTGSWQLW